MIYKLNCFIISLMLSLATYAQCGDAYYPLEEGVRFEHTIYKPNGKVTGKTTNAIIASDGASAVVKTMLFDKKEELLSEGDFEVLCENGTIRIAIERFIPGELLENYQNMEMTVEGDFMEIPNDLRPGQSLPDGSGKITIKMAEGPMNMTTTIDMAFTARNVEKAEAITTPAGTFDTYKITQKTTTKMTVMGMNRETTYTSASWLAKGVGTVKAESFNPKGKMDSYTLLTSFED